MSEIRPFQLAAIQFRPDKGHPDATLDHLVDCIHQAADEGADIVLFPESATTGYILEGAVESLATSPEDLRQALESRLNGLKRSLDFSLGFYERTPLRPRNSAAYFEWNGAELQVKHVYRKFFLPSYGVFDEHRYHEEGAGLGLVQTRFGKVGLLICEDIWHSILPTLLCVGGVQLILVHSASPARNFRGEDPGNAERYERMIRGLCEEHGIFCAMAMLAGSEGGKVLTGGSRIVNPTGETLVQAQNWGEQCIIAEIDMEEVRQARAGTPLASDLRERWPDIARIANRLVD